MAVCVLSKGLHMSWSIWVLAQQGSGNWKSAKSCGLTHYGCHNHFGNANDEQICETAWVSVCPYNVADAQYLIWSASSFHTHILPDTRHDTDKANFSAGFALKASPQLRIGVCVPWERVCVLVENALIFSISVLNKILAFIAFCTQRTI